MTTTPKPNSAASSTRKSQILREMMAQHSPETQAKARKIATKLLVIKAQSKARPTKADETDETDAP